MFTPRLVSDQKFAPIGSMTFTHVTTAEDMKTALAVAHTHKTSKLTFSGPPDEAAHDAKAAGSGTAAAPRAITPEAISQFFAENKDVLGVTFHAVSSVHTKVLCGSLQTDERLHSLSIP